MTTLVIQNQRPKTIINPDNGQAFTIFERMDATKDGAIIPVCVSFVTPDQPPIKLPSWIEFVPTERAANGHILIIADSGALRGKTPDYLEYLAVRFCHRLRRSSEPDMTVAMNGCRLKAKVAKWKEPYKGGIDIIMTVSGRADWLRQCLNSIVYANGIGLNDHLIIIDDNSPANISEILNDYKIRKSGRIITEAHTKRMGYLKSVNEGMRINLSSGKNPIILIMNSDILVAPGWLNKIRRAFTDPNVGTASLISNNMVNLSLPMLPGSSYLRMNEIMEIVGKESLQDAILPTGALLAFRRELIEQYGGGFDAEYYGEGYGEETDFLMWIKDIAKKRVAMVDTGYFYHSGGASHKDRKEKEKIGYDKFMARWGVKFQALLQKKREPMAEYRKARDVFPPVNEKKIAFYLHALELSGGYHVIANIVNRMIGRGIDARIVTSKLYDHSNKMVELFCEPFCFKNENDFVDRFAHEIFDEGILVANVWFTAPWVRAVADKYPKIKPVYYLQDYDPWFAGSDKEKQALDTYRLIDRKLCNANWSANMIKQKIPGVNIDVIPIGVDTKLFCPVDNWLTKKVRNSGRGPIRILGFHRPATSRRSPDELLMLLHLLKNKHGKSIEVGVFGDKFEGTKERLNLINYYGRIRQNELADLMRETDIFVDMSKFQGFGLTNLEAMASAVAVVSTDDYGIREYGIDGENCRIIPVGDVPAGVEAISALINDDEQRLRLAGEGLKTVKFGYDWEQITDRMISWFFGGKI